jgi:Ni/Fe-hydrogenase subunit HybB-like protein
MGYAVVVCESVLSSIFFKREPETKMLAGVGRAMVPVLFLYLVLRLVDLAARGRLGLVFAFDGYSLLFLAEIALFVTPAIMLLGSRRSLGHLFRASMLMLAAGTLYRFSTYVIAYSPGRGWSYFPAVPELIVTLGIVAFEVIAYVVLVKTFPILSAPPAHVPPADYAVAHAAAER